MKDALGHGSEKRPIPGSPMHSKTNDELRFIQRDAHEAGKNAQEMGDQRGISKYADQVNDASTVLGYRARGGKSDAPSDVLHSGTAKSNMPRVHDSMVGAKDANGRYVIPGGQGHDPSHTSSPLASTAMAKGYSYSHSTPIHMQDGSIQMHHTYASGEHKVGVSGNKWETTVSSGSGHSTRGTGADSLAKHLASKASRYPGLRG